MKFLVSTLIFLSAVTAFAATATPMNLDGTYKFNGQLENTFTRDNQVVYGFTEAGIQEMQKLQNEGYNCSNTGREIYLCQKLQDNDILSTAMQSRLLNKFQNLSVSFLERTADISLDIDASDFSEWTISQKVSMGSRTLPAYRYQVLEGTLHKIALGEAGAMDTEYFIVDSVNRLEYMYSEAETTAHGYVEYFGSAILEK